MNRDQAKVLLRLYRKGGDPVKSVPGTFEPVVFKMLRNLGAIETQGNFPLGNAAYRNTGEWEGIVSRNIEYLEGKAKTEHRE